MGDALHVIWQACMRNGRHGDPYVRGREVPYVRGVVPYARRGVVPDVRGDVFLM